MVSLLFRAQVCKQLLEIQEANKECVEGSSSTQAIPKSSANATTCTNSTVVPVGHSTTGGRSIMPPNNQCGAVTTPSPSEGSRMEVCQSRFGQISIDRTNSRDVLRIQTTSNQPNNHDISPKDKGISNEARNISNKNNSTESVPSSELEQTSGYVSANQQQVLHTSQLRQQQTSQLPSNLEGRFWVTPGFLKVIRKVQGINPAKMVFTYKEVSVFYLFADFKTSILCIINF